MIKFDIENFQSIKNLGFKVKGFTVIVGKTNIGKSAIIRSIKSALRNNRGNFYIRKGTKKCQLVLNDQDKVDIQWEKGKGNNYTINGAQFSNVGLSVPSEIADLGFKTISVGNKELDPQIADQFNPLFLIDGKGGSSAEVLFDISRIKVLNEAQRLVEKDQRDSKSLLKTRVSDLSEVRGEIEKLKGVTEIRKAFDSLQSNEQDLSTLKLEVKEILGFDQKLAQKSSDIKSLLTIEGVEVPEVFLDSLFNKYESINELQVLFEKCQETVLILTPYEGITVPDLDLSPELLELKGLTQQLQEYSKILTTISKIDSVEKTSVPEEESLDFDVVTWIQSMIDTLIEIKNNLKDLKSLESTCEEELSRLDSEIEGIKQELQVCPLCERSF